jgi:tetratricopeptide (TPR) repeat protein
MRRIGRAAAAAVLAGLSWAAADGATPGAPDPAAAPPHLAHLRAALEAGDLPEAIRVGEKAVAADPTSSEARDLLGRAYGLTARDSPLLEQMHLARKARECFARAVELDGTNVGALSDLARYDMRAPALLGGGRKKARASAERVLALDPARGHVLLGELAEMEKKPAEAESQYRQAIAASPADPQGRQALSALYVSRRQYAPARALWSEARDEDALGAYELAGIALASGEGLAGAVEDLEGALGRSGSEAAATDPTRAELHERLARVYEKLGRKGEAAAELETALALSPGRSDWRRALQALSR